MNTMQSVLIVTYLTGHSMTDMKIAGTTDNKTIQSQSWKCVYINVIFYASVYEGTCPMHVADKKWDEGVQ